MTRLFLTTGPGGVRAINLELVREFTQDADGKVTLRFDREDKITVEGSQARDCMAAINEMAGYAEARA
jgi:hypothetical protein